jgi:hypothetical protein
MSQRSFRPAKLKTSIPKSRFARTQSENILARVATNGFHPRRAQLDYEEAPSALKHFGNKMNYLLP